MIYAGTGEPNTCRSGCIAGVGLYKSKDGGNHWSGPIGTQYFAGRGIGSIQVKPGDPSTIFVGSGAQGSRGISNTCCTGVDRGGNIPGAPHFGLWRSTDGGADVRAREPGQHDELHDRYTDRGFQRSDAVLASWRASRAFRPRRPDTVYATFGAKGIWRSSSNGDPGTWVQIFAPRGPATSPATGADVERAEFDVVEHNGGTRMYIGVGGGAGQTSRVFRSDSVRAGAPMFIELTNDTSAGYCDPQCNYDNYVYVPRKADGSAQSADTVYLLGDNDYTQAAQGTSNGRAVLLSTDAGATFTDMTYDAMDDLQPHGIHPDQHSILTDPADWKRFLETGDGGIVRSNGNFFDDSAQCARYSPPLTPTRLATCRSGDQQDPGAPRVHQQGAQHAPLLPGDVQPESPRRAGRRRAGQRLVDAPSRDEDVGRDATSPTEPSTASTPAIRTTRRSPGSSAHWRRSTSHGTSRRASSSPTRWQPWARRSSATTARRPRSARRRCSTRRSAS